MKWDWLVEWLLGFLGDLLANISPAIREVLKRMVLGLWEEAKKTENPWDDLLCVFLAGLVGVELPKRA